MNGLRLPNLPGFLLSATIPKKIEENAEIASWNEIPIEVSMEAKLMVYT
ncbi:hypothetical protein LCGC14_0541000 [marine sediment metagenome]|uniref:Uncharacterized protein n=1 Tax=marine sediment metagenome TaxID=412755 RepID=A0A0F9SBA3_9ZZZZ|nr:MAG: hypothetical protein Lokiarch_41220 [Candidatus Lokiarchaeum sp. GC14_75]